jgi:uncharacterized protein YbaR (Trm112 family)
MFIELTDYLRCPADHDESYLVLLPEQMEARSVVAGALGCPVCGRTYRVQDGIALLGEPPFTSDSETMLDPPGLIALVGLSGPGGYLALVGSAGSLWSEVKDLSPGVGLVAINPPEDVPDAPGLSVIRSGRMPLKSRSMRGVVLGARYGDDPYWVDEASRVILPGLRVVGVGTEPVSQTVELMASAGQAWVGTTGRSRRRRVADADESG